MNSPELIPNKIYKVLHNDEDFAYIKFIDDHIISRVNGFDVEKVFCSYISLLDQKIVIGPIQVVIKKNNIILSRSFRRRI